jgi:hypothetical protein
MDEPKLHVPDDVAHVLIAALAELGKRRRDVMDALVSSAVAPLPSGSEAHVDIHGLHLFIRPGDTTAAPNRVEAVARSLDDAAAITRRLRAGRRADTYPPTEFAVVETRECQGRRPKMDAAARRAWATFRPTLPSVLRQQAKPSWIEPAWWPAGPSRPADVAACRGEVWLFGTHPVSHVRVIRIPRARLLLVVDIGRIGASADELEWLRDLDAICPLLPDVTGRVVSDRQIARLLAGIVADVTHVSRDDLVPPNPKRARSEEDRIRPALELLYGAAWMLRAWPAERTQAALGRRDETADALRSAGLEQLANRELRTRLYGSGLALQPADLDR